MKINKYLFKVLNGSKEFCCLCLKDEIENVIHIEDQVHIDGLEINEYIEIGDLLTKIVDKDIIEVVRLFETICKPCSKLAIDYYKFLQSTQENYQKLVKSIQSLSELLQFVNDKSKTVFLDVNANKQFFVDKVLTGDVLENFMTLQKLNSNENIKKEEELTKKIYKCNFCSKLMASKDDLKHHKISNHLEKIKCDICNTYFNTTAELKSHKHIHKAKFICTVCGKVFISKRALENHENRHQVTIVCSACGRVYKNKDSFRIHIIHNICSSTSRAPPNNGKFICDYCNKRYTQKMSLRTHIQYEHLNYKSHECKYCKKKFWAQSRLNTHILKHTKEKKFKCLTCGGCFVTKDTLLYHTRMHTGEKPYKCEECGERFISASRRLIHHKKEHIKETFRCDICSIEYSTKYRLQKHVKLKHELSNDMILETMNNK